MLRPVYSDELYHHGKLGMKWGKRTAAIKEGIGARNQATKDMIRHPVHSTAAQLSMIKNHPLKAIGGGTQAFKDLNADVKNRVENSKKPKTKKTVQEHVSAGAKHVGPALKVIGANVLAANRHYQEQKMANQIFK